MFGSRRNAFAVNRTVGSGTERANLWKYTLPCIQWACATFPACNWHGGYALMFLAIRLNRTLEMMQNDVETSEFEYRSMEIWLFLDDDV